MIEESGPFQMREAYVKPPWDRLFEIGRRNRASDLYPGKRPATGCASLFREEDRQDTAIRAADGAEESRVGPMNLAERKKSGSATRNFSGIMKR
jgi:hypothetical protein